MRYQPGGFFDPVRVSGMNICPCCKQPVVGNDLLVSLDTNCVSRNGTIVHLEPRMVVLLSVLHNKAPGVVSIEKIIRAMYGREEPRSEAPETVLRVRISQMRRLLAPLGVEIKNEYGRGYRLNVD